MSGSLEPDAALLRSHDGKAAASGVGDGKDGVGVHGNGGDLLLAAGNSKVAERTEKKERRPP